MFEGFVEKRLAGLVRDLQRLVRIPSVKSKPSPGAPFGFESRRCLNEMLLIAAELGFTARSIDGYCGEVIYGEGTRSLGVLTHLDVVPAEDGWRCPPFAGEIVDGRMVGRGTADDKGPAIASLYALAVLRDAGFQPKKEIRLIFGTDEETGSGDMAYYREHCPLPDMSFSPDALFPVVNAEKGITHLRLRKARTSSTLRSFRSGVRPNVVPDTASCEIVCGRAVLARVLEALPHPYTHELAEKNGILRAAVYGRSAHGSSPELGANAAIALAKALKEATDDPAAADLWALARCFDAPHDGARLNIPFRDEPSGALTANLGLLGFDGQVITGDVDIRYPVTYTYEDVASGMISVLQPMGFTLEPLSRTAPLYVPEDNELVSTLLAVFKEKTGRAERPLAIGGGTYARHIQNAVAFGALLPEQENVTHQKDEYTELSHLAFLTDILALAMLRLTERP
ncbi:dipeptidase PepV [Gehongia tenuis]|uniref:Dipeptidase PepV n=1 Tax=Gehongia tenuis TaxID=2763655 RepID=A0A926D5H4_9FIRM|nr:dipeptidase PepV [Gehongia tenuis]MBC8532103.1 dipeptidase PepV [Gehongia tenuis]